MLTNETRKRIHNEFMESIQTEILFIFFFLLPVSMMKHFEIVQILVGFIHLPTAA